MGKRILTVLFVLTILPIVLFTIVWSGVVEIAIISPIYWVVTGKDGVEFIGEKGLFPLVGKYLQKVINKLK